MQLQLTGEWVILIISVLVVLLCFALLYATLRRSRVVVPEPEEQESKGPTAPRTPRTQRPPPPPPADPPPDAPDLPPLAQSVQAPNHLPVVAIFVPNQLQCFVDRPSGQQPLPKAQQFQTSTCPLTLSCGHGGIQPAPVLVPPSSGQQQPLPHCPKLSNL
eukprot:s7619_g3.t1